MRLTLLRVVASMVRTATLHAHHHFTSNRKQNMKYLNRLTHALTLVALGWSGMTWAQANYPDRTISLVVPFAAGGPTDVVARAFADHASRALGQPFVVDNKPGANTILAAQAVASAPADGYTLLFGATNHTMIPGLYAGRVKIEQG